MINLIGKPESEIRGILKIGMYYSLCCHEDIAQIESQDDIDNIVELVEDGISVNCEYDKNKLYHELEYSFI